MNNVLTLATLSYSFTHRNKLAKEGKERNTRKERNENRRESKKERKKERKK